jgi:hypothetical protein
MKKIILLLLIFVGAAAFLKAQIPIDEENSGFLKDLSEQVRIFTDRDIYLSGEEVWFSIYVLANNEPVDLSKVVYVELFDETKRKLNAVKFEIIKGKASGNFTIPEETTSGTYFIRTYTRYQRNFPPESFTSKTISVINPEFPLPTSEESSANFITELNASDEAPNEINKLTEIHIASDKTNYNKREPVELNITWPDTEFDEILGLSVSIARQGTIDYNKLTTASMYQTSNKNSEFTGDIFWVPETRGVSISGFVQEKKSAKPMAGINVYLSVLGADPQFHISKTKENGAFVFSLGYIQGDHEVFVGVKQENDEEIELLVNNDFSGEFPALQEIPLAIDSSYRTLLEEMLVNHQSQSIFSKIKDTPIDTTVYGFDIFGSPDVSVYLTDYIDLANLETVFFELVNTAMVREKDGQKTLYVVNPETNKVFSNQLLLLDHVPVFNFENVLNIPPEKIKNIDVINSTHYLGDNTLKSVVMMNTYAGDFAGYFFPEGSIFLEYQAINPGKEFCSPVYETQIEKESRLPDFRTTLYWNPDISISGEEATINFYTSDNRGKYDVVVRGVTKSGEICYGISSISIE